MPVNQPRSRNHSGTRAMAHKTTPSTIIPDHFLPGIGYVVVQQTQLDHAINELIWFLAKVSHTEGRTITSTIINIGTRLELFRRLTIVNVTDKMDRDKLQAINIRAGELVSMRNRISHDRPYSYSKSKDEITFFREESLTEPQIKDQAPTLMTRKSLKELGDEMIKITRWLGLYLPNFPNRKHPDWSDNALFPWPDKLPKRSQQLNPSPD